MASWQDRRRKGSNGFMAMRLIKYFHMMDMILFGNSFIVNYGKIYQLLNHSDVVLKQKNDKIMMAPTICWLRPDVFTKNGKACETCQRLCPYNDNNRKEIKTK